MNPQVRDRSADREKWNRWDTSGGRTLYAADTALGAYAEVLAYIRENLPKTPLSELFPDDDPTEGDDQTTLTDQVRAEMPAPTLRDKITPGWRAIRTHYELKISSSGWFVDVLTGPSIQTLNHVFIPTGETVGTMTSANLTGEQRQLTTSVAEWVRNQVLDDGSLPMGIKYQSKHGNDIPAYAIWLRALDDGKSPRSEHVQLVTETAVKKDDPDLREVASWYDLKVL
ncbi:MAG: RES domain-containing protein [Nakamurella sp.]